MSPSYCNKHPSVLLLVWTFFEMFIFSQLCSIVCLRHSHQAERSSPAGLPRRIWCIRVDDVLSAVSVIEVGRLERWEMGKAVEKLLDKEQLLFGDFPRGGGRVETALHYLIDGLQRREDARLRSARTKGLKGSWWNWIRWPGPGENQQTDLILKRRTDKKWCVWFSFAARIIFFQTVLNEILLIIQY